LGTVPGATNRYEEKSAGSLQPTPAHVGHGTSAIVAVGHSAAIAPSAISESQRALGCCCADSDLADARELPRLPDPSLPLDPFRRRTRKRILHLHSVDIARRATISDSAVRLFNEIEGMRPRGRP
jgi:hypothetical protein